MLAFNRLLYRAGLFDSDAEALVDAALALVLDDADRADLPRVMDVEAAVGLEVESLDVDSADLLNGLGDEVDLGADEVGDGDR